MKPNALLKSLMMLLIALSISITSCNDDDDPAMPLYNTSDNVFGKSQEAWQVEWWQFLMSHDCNTFGTASTETQTGDVHFLSGPLETYTMNISVRQDQAILSPVLNYLNDYPCPDSAFHPAPGQSLEAFLQEGAAGIMTYAQDLKVSLDGQDIPINEDNRSITSLFYFTGNPDLANCKDACVTGVSQAAVSDGYWLLIKPLSKGQHTLSLDGKLAFEPPLVLKGTIHITVN